MRMWTSGLVALGTVMALAAPSVADTGTLDDPRGDARPKAVDWTRLTVTNTPSTITARIDFVDLPARGLKTKRFGWLAFGTTLRISAPENNELLSYAFGASRKRRETNTTIRRSTPEGETTISCPGLEVDWVAGRRSFVQFTIPSSCVGLSTVAATASAYYAIEGDLFDGQESVVVVEQS